ncbi:MAG: prepilin-type N-terminal cleavage/methylation domain-containing protein [Geothrix sp.]|nr:prepilin-type N-terminal cleavage/methylation domain-containing protein [Geothrix sp.]
MAKPRTREHGFSLVELLVALVFTMVLMAGMANVYKASLSTFYTSGEALSSARRNRMSVDLLIDDLNTTCMYLTDLSVPPPVSAAVPPFFILPNMPIAGAGANDPATCDELYFYMDQALAFEGALSGAAPQQTASELVVAGTVPGIADNTFIIECKNSSYANQVQRGQIFIFKDSWETAYITNPPTVSGSLVSVVAGPAPNAMVSGAGPAGLPSKAKHLPNSGIVFLLPAQMVRYRIAILNLDPSNPNGIPCLVRDQGTYDAAVFTPTATQQVISENISGFKVYLSTNAGTSWAGLLPSGLPAAYTGFNAGWDQGIRSEVDVQLAATGRPDYRTTRASEHWFRSIPTLVRVDVSTRTATQRAEYSDNGLVPAYRNLTQSLVFVPRHSGLTMN